MHHCNTRLVLAASEWPLWKTRRQWLSASNGETKCTISVQKYNNAEELTQKYKSWKHKIQNTRIWCRHYDGKTRRMQKQSKPCDQRLFLAGSYVTTLRQWGTIMTKWTSNKKHEKLKSNHKRLLLKLHWDITLFPDGNVITAVIWYLLAGQQCHWISIKQSSVDSFLTNTYVQSCE